MPRVSHLKVTIVAVAAMVLSCAQTLKDCLQGFDERRAAAAASHRPYGAFSEAQILARSRPLFAALLPDRAPRALVASRQGDYWHGGARHRLWNIQCVDEHKSIIASMLLDADTGRTHLLSARWPQDAARLAASPAISPAAAVKAATDWAEKLAPHERWHASKSPAESRLAWHIKLGAPGRTAFLCFDKRSGSLVYASITGKFSRYTVAQVAGQCRPIFRELISQPASFTVKVEPAQVQTHEGATQRQWGVTCLNAQRNVVARLVRDADTGRVSLFAGQTAKDNGRALHHKPVSLAAAIAAAKRGVQVMGYTEERWRVSSTSQSQRVWHVQLKTEESVALLTLDKQTGLLLYASVHKNA